VCPNADPYISFGVRGPGRVAGVDNGDPTSHEPFQGRRRKAFHGLALVVIQSGRQAGEVRLTAAADGLASDAVSIRAGQRPPHPSAGKAPQGR
jgi:beta-galactosidase